MWCFPCCSSMKWMSAVCDFVVRMMMEMFVPVIYVGNLCEGVVDGEVGS